MWHILGTPVAWCERWWTFRQYPGARNSWSCLHLDLCAVFPPWDHLAACHLVTNSLIHTKLWETYSSLVEVRWGVADFIFERWQGRTKLNSEMFTFFFLSPSKLWFVTQQPSCNSSKVCWRYSQADFFMIRRNILWQEEINLFRLAAYPPDVTGASIQGCFNSQRLPLITFKRRRQCWAIISTPKSFSLMFAIIPVTHSGRMNSQWKWQENALSSLQS